MLTYRGQLCISRSWETESEQDLNTEHLQEVAKIRKKYGTKKAVEKYGNCYDSNKEGAFICISKNYCKRSGSYCAFTADEIVKLCNSLHYAPEKQQNDIYHKLYHDLLLVRDICRSGRIDNWGLAKVVEQRGLGNINKHIRGPKIKALKARRL